MINQTKTWNMTQINVEMLLLSVSDAKNVIYVLGLFFLLKQQKACIVIVTSDNTNSYVWLI